MKVMLQETVEGLGHLGDLVEVSNGFARNYLLPRRKALEANTRNMKVLEHTKRVTAEKAKKERLEFEGLAKQISEVSLIIPVQVGKENKLFGAVTAKDIAEGIGQQGFMVDRRKIHLDHPIKELGTFTIPVKLHRDATATVTVQVVPQKEPSESTEAS